jgi:pimeloyl-ACP methyl ester carboxylesterase
MLMLHFIHGLNGAAAEWNPFLEYFTKIGYLCKAIELQEGMNLRKIHFQDYVDKVISLIKKEDILIGHSMGGMIIQKIAELTSIKAGICICPSPPKGIPIKSLSYISQIRYLPFFIASIPFRPSFSLAHNHFLNGIPLEIARKQYQNLKKQSARVSYEILKAKIPVDETKVNSPLFFIARNHDKIISPQIVKQIAEKYHGPIKYLDGNHYIFSDPEPISRCINEYIQYTNVEK